MIWFFLFTGLGLTIALFLLITRELLQVSARRIVGGALLVSVLTALIRVSQIT
ncbi:MAG TPA: hypothetical protein PKO06_00805 [Candidatus Ozemobacteraceae bacterium]|nr:hypothetical protein [Candidatus Ozemobacteraceae bacterium]